MDLKQKLPEGMIISHQISEMTGIDNHKIILDISNLLLFLHSNINKENMPRFISYINNNFITGYDNCYGEYVALSREACILLFDVSLYHESDKELVLEFWHRLDSIR